MSNAFVLGSSGAGKTTYVVEREILPHLRDGGIVVTNVTLKMDRFVEEFGHEFCEKHIIHLPVGKHPNLAFSDISFWHRHIFHFSQNPDHIDEKGRGPKFIVDEAHKLFPKRMQKPVDKLSGKPIMEAFGNQLEQLLTDQRHYLINNVFITQVPAALAPFVIEQMHSTAFIDNAGGKGFETRFTVKHWRGPPPSIAFKTLQKVPASDCDDAEGFPKPIKYNAQSWEFFESQSMAVAKEITDRTAGVAGTSAPKGRAAEGKYFRGRSVWMRPSVWLGFAAIAALFILVPRLYNKVGVQKPADTSEQAATSPGRPSAVRAVATKVADVVDGGATVIDQMPSASSRAQQQDWDIADGFQVRMHHDSWKAVDGRIGPAVYVSSYDGTVHNVYMLADFSSVFGYTLTPIQCGYSLSRGSKLVHQLYSTQCLQGGLTSGYRGQTDGQAAPAVLRTDGAPAGVSAEAQRPADVVGQASPLDPWSIGRARDRDAPQLGSDVGLAHRDGPNSGPGSPRGG